MNALDTYYNHTTDILSQAFRLERDAMEQAAQAIADASAEKRSLFAFGCNHAALITLELFYRTGGLVTINPVRAPGMMLEVSPITMSSEMERLPEYGRVLLQALPAKAGDVIILHSVSGRNSVSIDMACAAKEKGMTVIVVTNMTTSTAVSSRHPSGKKLFDFADILIDNHGDLGDATVKLPGFPQKVASTSTVVGAAILNAIVARACEMLWEQGIRPPVFMSGNIDGGDAHNMAVIAEHQDQIFYM